MQSINQILRQKYTKSINSQNSVPNFAEIITEKWTALNEELPIYECPPAPKNKILYTLEKEFICRVINDRETKTDDHPTKVVNN